MQLTTLTLTPLIDELARIAVDPRMSDAEAEARIQDAYRELREWRPVTTEPPTKETEQTAGHAV